MFDKYILHFDANKKEFSGLGYLPKKMYIYKNDLSVKV